MNLQIKKFDIVRRYDEYGVIIERGDTLLFLPLFWLGKAYYIKHVTHPISDSMKKVVDESFIRFLIYKYPRIISYISMNEEFKYLSTMYK
jgi:hypothetical protein